MKANNQSNANKDFYAAIGNDVFTFDSKDERDDFVKSNGIAKKITAKEAYKMIDDFKPQIEKPIMASGNPLEGEYDRIKFSR